MGHLPQNPKSRQAVLDGFVLIQESLTHEGRGHICQRTMNRHNRFESSLSLGLVVWPCRASNYTWDCSRKFSAEICPRFLPRSCIAWLDLICTWRWSWTCCIVAWTWSASRRRWSRSFVGPPANNIWRSTPWTAKNGVDYVDSDIPLFTANSAKGGHFTQSSWWWFTNIRRNCSMLAFICSVCSSLCGWMAVDILQSIPKQSKTIPQYFEANRGSRKSIHDYPHMIKPFVLE